MRWERRSSTETHESKTSAIVDDLHVGHARISIVTCHHFGGEVLGVRHPTQADRGVALGREAHPCVTVSIGWVKWGIMGSFVFWACIG